MAALEETRAALSLAQVEEELRNAEAYLTAGEVSHLPPITPPDDFEGKISASVEEWAPRAEGVLDRGAFDCDA
jgi:hypothetical protein